MGIESSFRKLKYTIGLSNFHAYKPEYIKQEIWAKLIVYNITESLINHTMVEHGDTKHKYKVNFNAASHICRAFLRPSTEKGQIDVMSLLKRELIPIRDGREYPWQKQRISEDPGILYIALHKAVPSITIIPIIEADVNLLACRATKNTLKRYIPCFLFKHPY